MAAAAPARRDVMFPAPRGDRPVCAPPRIGAPRPVADQVIANMPTARTVARENRKFLGRAVRFLVAEAGIRQFLDIGAGLPTTENVHEVAQRTDPTARIVYADNDPLVLVHARALLRGTPEGRTGYIHADLREPAAILAEPVTSEVLDFTEPIGLILVSVLPFLTDDDHPGEILATLLGGLPSGSYLAATHTTAEHDPDGWAATGRAHTAAAIRGQLRDSAEFARMAFTGLDLVPPGVVLVSEWGPDDDGPLPLAAEVSCYGGVARKP
jgi:hypothetical protein